MSRYESSSVRSKPRPVALFLLPLIGVLATQGCGAPESTKASPTPSSSPAAVTLNSEERANGVYALAAVGSVPSGAVTFTLDNFGDSERGAQLVRVEADHDAAETFTALRTVASGGPMPAWLAWAGGIGVVRPGQHYVFSVVLKPGRYYVVDGSFQGKASAVAKLESRAQLDVVQADYPAKLPQAAASIAATDNGFTPQGLSVGSAVVRLQNTGKQPHNVVLSRILPGKTLGDVNEYVASDDDAAPPPVDLGNETVSGTLSPGMQQTLELDLRAGNYALLCFASDLLGGPPHVVTGAADEVRVG